MLINRRFTQAQLDPKPLIRKKEEEEQEAAKEETDNGNSPQQANVEPQSSGVPIGYNNLEAFLSANQFNIVTVTPEKTTLSDEEALSKAMKDMGLRKTYAQNIYCETHNPNKPEGDNSELRHYYWDKTNQKMVELPNVYYVSADGLEVKDMIEGYTKTGSMTASSGTSEDVLAKTVREMGLRRTNAQGIYCEMHNPNKPAGDNSELRHYYWDETNQKMVELTGVYFVSADGHEVKDMIDNYNKTGSVNTPEQTPEADEVPEETPSVNEPSPDEPEKAETTIQNLQDLYGIYRPAMIEIKSTFHGYLLMKDLNGALQDYIDNNKLDISLENLKSFFSDVMDKQPSGAMAGEQYLIERFNDYIENGYTPSFNIDDFHRQQDELYKDYQDALSNSNSGAPETPENSGISTTPTTPGQTPPTQEELDAIQKVINDNLNKTFGIFSDDEDTPEAPSTKTTTELFDEITPSKPELREYVSNIMANDDDVDPSGINQYGYFTERELDTFVDSIISQVVKNSDSQDVETLLSEIKDAINSALKSDPYAPMNINKSLMATDDYLLSDEEKKLKADLVDVEFDSDPTKIDGSGFDYSVMSNANDRVADLTADWDISDIESALNCKSPYTGGYSKNSSTITLYKNLEQMKPQLKAYIKEQLSAQGLEYNEQTVEKYLNYYITETVREAIQAKYHDRLPELYPNTVLPSNATLQDLGEYLVTKVKDEIAEGRTSFGTTWSASGFDPLLNSTSDYFLTPEEIAQKKQMNNKKSGI